MSELAKEARAKAREKARRLTTADPHQKVDASGWTPPEDAHMDVKTGLRPISRQARKRGGKVEGQDAHHHAGKTPRKGGGRALADALVNRNVKDANEEREGVKHDGGLKGGGRAKRAGGGGLGGLGVLGPMAGIIPSLIASSVMGGDNDGDERKGAPYSPGAPGAGPKRRGGRTGKADGGPLAGAISQGIGGQGRMSFNYPQAKSLMQTAGGMRRGGKAEKCMGGSARASGGRSNAEQTGLRPEGGRIARKDGGGEALRRATGGHVPDGGWGRGEEREAHKKGGRAGKGKMNVNIVIAPGGHGPPQPAAAGPPPGMPPKPQGVPVPLSGGAPGMMAPGMPMPMMGGAMPGAAPPMQPPGMPPMMPRKRGGRAYEAGSGGGEGRLEKMRHYGANAKPDAKHY